MPTKGLIIRETNKLKNDSGIFFLLDLNFSHSIEKENSLLYRFIEFCYVYQER